MKKLIIKGGNKLKGSIEISGAKNASLPILMSTILIDNGENIFHNIPDVADIKTAKELLTYLGANIIVDTSKKTLKISANNIKTMEAPYDIVSKMRASLWILGSLLSRFGEAKVSLPGGCAIGQRPCDIYIDVLKQMNIDIKIENGYIIAKAIDGKIKGADVTLRLPSVGVTHNTIMAATLANGKTIIRNAAKEPEVIDLCNFLINAGADIKGAGTNIIEINGVKNLHPTEYTIMGDRIEAFSYMIAAAITKGDLVLSGLNFFKVLENPINSLLNIGVNIETISDNKIHVYTNKDLKPINITTSFFPQFPTDCQAAIVALLGVVNGKSIVDETIYENRFMHIPELNRLGANIEVDNNKAVINGVKNYKGAIVMASDLRAGMALVLAGLQASGITEVNRIYHIERGYENFVEKLKNCGADLKIIE